MKLALPTCSAAALALGLSFLASCETADYPDIVAGAPGSELEPHECGDIHRVHTYAGFYLASQPTAADFQQAKAEGVKTVLDLRHAGELPDFDEAAIVGASGLAYHNIPFKAPDELTDEVFDQALEIMAKEERTILVHCKSANRVGAIWLAYRTLHTPAEIGEALAEARVIGLTSPDFEEAALSYVQERR